MASSLLVLLDDIATILDDVATMTKVAARQSVAAADDVAAMTQMAAKKTAGVLGDDLALNAQQVTGVKADRELPVVWAVARGSLLNKAILVPAALAISAFLPWLITPLLMLGGLFLCFEGAEKLLHKSFKRSTATTPIEIEDERTGVWTKVPAHSDAERAHRDLVNALNDESVDIVEFEKDKVKGAIRTDFILSAEIIVITLGTVAAASFAQRVSVLVGISILMTVGVYGLVAGIVKLDDAGLHLSRSASGAVQALGRGLLAFAPRLMKALSVLGTAAMFLVGGGILLHGVPALGHAVEHWAEGLGAVGALVNNLAGGVAGLIAGAIVVLVVQGAQKLRGAPAH